MDLQTGGHQTLAAGTGTFGYEPNVNYLLGFPRSIKPGGVMFDIPLVKINAVDNGHADQLKQFTVQTGLLSSALEHAVPEQLFVNEQNPGEAISAVKALQKANAQGQRIYHITQANQAAILPNIHHDPDTIDEITPLNAGQEVIIHTDAVLVKGWSGAGYIIIDPATGDGAYKIAGGGNGGIIFILGFGIMLIGALMVLGVASAGSLFGSMIVATTILALGIHIVILELLFNPDLKWDSIKSNILTMVGIFTGPFGFLGDVAAAIVFSISILLGLYGII